MGDPLLRRTCRSRMDGSPMTTHLSTPITVNWGITARCNFVCSHCFSRLDRSRMRAGSWTSSRRTG
jgi:MoaA/NifB/PqqE/SkfB family radical SAM enzyme